MKSVIWEAVGIVGVHAVVVETDMHEEAEAEVVIVNQIADLEVDRDLKNILQVHAIIKENQSQEDHHLEDKKGNYSYNFLLFPFKFVNFFIRVSSKGNENNHSRSGSPNDDKWLSWD